jgi:hypothetical protein
VPRARVAQGSELPVKRTDVGRFRIAVPAATEGATGADVTITAELVPAPVVAGDPPELVFASKNVRLEGPPPAIKSRAPDAEVETEVEEEEGGPGVRVGLAAAAVAGATLGIKPLFGGGAFGELRLPVWDWRLGARLGLLYYRTGGTGTLAYASGQTLETSATIAGLLVPLDLAVAVVKTDGFELVTRAGLSLRFDRGAFDVGEDRIAAASKFGVSGQVSAEAAFDLGPGAFFGAITFGGIGASASSLFAGNTQVDGSLMHLSLDVGYRFWL